VCVCVWVCGGGGNLISWASYTELFSEVLIRILDPRKIRHNFFWASYTKLFSEVLIRILDPRKIRHIFFQTNRTTHAKIPRCFLKLRILSNNALNNPNPRSLTSDYREITSRFVFSISNSILTTTCFSCLQNRLYRILISQKHLFAKPREVKTSHILTLSFLVHLKVLYISVLYYLYVIFLIFQDVEHVVRYCTLLYIYETRNVPYCAWNHFRYTLPAGRTGKRHFLWRRIELQMMTRLVLISEFLSVSGRDGCAVDDVT